MLYERLIAAAAAKSLQLGLTLCDPIGSLRYCKKEIQKVLFKFFWTETQLKNTFYMDTQYTGPNKTKFHQTIYPLIMYNAL